MCYQLNLTNLNLDSPTSGVSFNHLGLSYKGVGDRALSLPVDAKRTLS